MDKRLNRRQEFWLRRHRSSFTLVELLVSIAIIGTMAGMVVYTLAGALEDSLRTRTAGTIEKINSVILERWEQYRYRSVKLPIPVEFTQRVGNRPPRIGARQLAAVRSVLLKDMMRMEMPDRLSDLSYTPTNVQFRDSQNNVLNLDDFGGRTPSREYNLLRSYFGLPIIPDPYQGPIQAVLGPSGATPDIEPAELLYAIVAHSTFGGGSALELFHASEISDTDQDGFLEFVDAWGNAIGWIRWPAAHPSKLNLSYRSMVSSGSGNALPAAPDAFDPLRTDPFWSDASFTQKPWTLVPLVISSGADEESGIGVDVSGQPPFVFAEWTPPANAAPLQVYRSPFFPSTDAPVIGRLVNPTAATDNVTNHQLLLEE